MKEPMSSSVRLDERSERIWREGARVRDGDLLRWGREKIAEFTWFVQKKCQRLCEREACIGYVTNRCVLIREVL